MKDNDAKINEIYDAIVGSDLHPDGLIKRVATLEKWALTVKKTTWVITGVILSVSAIFKLLNK